MTISYSVEYPQVDVPVLAIQINEFVDSLDDKVFDVIKVDQQEALGRQVILVDNRIQHWEVCIVASQFDKPGYITLTHQKYEADDRLRDVEVPRCITSISQIQEVIK